MLCLKLGMKKYCPVSLLAKGTSFPNLHIYSVEPRFIDMIDPAPVVNHFESAAIILTQACDLENDPRPDDSVIVATLTSLKGKSWTWTSNTLRGNRPALHVINEYHSDVVDFDFHFVDFSDLFTVPYSILNQAREMHPTRLRLRSPYLEHVAQRFGTYFSRIGLPQGIDEAVIKEFIKKHHPD